MQRRLLQEGITKIKMGKREFIEIDTEIIPRGKKFRINGGRLKTVGKGCGDVYSRNGRYVYYKSPQ